jgi:hypothetical protein
MPHLISVHDVLVLVKINALIGTGAKVDRVTLCSIDALRIGIDLANKISSYEVSFADPTLSDGMVFRLLGVPVHKVEALAVGTIDIRCT